MNLNKRLSLEGIKNQSNGRVKIEDNPVKCPEPSAFSPNSTGSVLAA